MVLLILIGFDNQVRPCFAIDNSIIKILRNYVQRFETCCSMFVVPRRNQYCCSYNEESTTSLLDYA